MGCIVNGPGEMADADYGYVGAVPGRITLYKGRTVVARNIPQEEALATYAAKLTKADGHIDWDEKAAVIHARIRGVTPWPGAQTVFLLPGRDPLPALLQPGRVGEAFTGGQPDPGSLIALRDGMLLIACRHAPSADAIQMLRYLHYHNIPFVVALTKADKLKKSQLAKTQEEFETLCLPYGCQKVVLTSGENGYGIPELQAVLDAAIAAEYKENAEDAE